MSEPGSNSVLSQEELEAAIAEVESLAPGEGGIPNLDDGRESQVVPIPVPGPNAQQADAPDGDDATRDAAASGAVAPQATAGEPSAAVAADTPSTGAIARLLSRLPVRRGRGARKSSAERPSDSAAAGQMSRVFRALDATLTLINRPFAGLSPHARRIVGLVGVVTIIMSLLAAFVLPLLIARNDALSFLREKRAELLVAPANPSQAPNLREPPAPRRSQP